MVFSVIIPIFNSENYISDCLDSLLSQSFQSFEVVCVNDGSTDSSLQILEEYSQRDSRIKVKTIVNSGVSIARNVGLETASGDYVVFLDSDDFLVPGALSVLDNAISSENYDIVVFGFRKVNDSDGSVCGTVDLDASEFQTGWEYFNACASVYPPGTFGCVCGRAYSKTIYNQIHFASDIRYHEDTLFAIDACRASSKVKVIDESLYVYRIGRSGSAMSTTNSRRFTDMARVANKIAEAFVPAVCIEKDVIYRMAASYYRNALLWCPASMRKDVRRVICWPSFSVVSSVTAKSRLSFLMMRLLPRLSVVILNKIKGR